MIPGRRTSGPQTLLSLVFATITTSARSLQNGDMSVPLSRPHETATASPAHAYAPAPRRLLAEEALDRRPEPRVAKPVAAVRRRRRKTRGPACAHPARPPRTAASLASDAAVDRRVVRRLEVEKLDLLLAAPVAPVQPRRGLKEQRPRDRPLAPAHPRPLHPLRLLRDHRREEARLQVVLPVVILRGRAIKAVDRRAVLGRELRSPHPLDRRHSDACTRARSLRSCLRRREVMRPRNSSKLA
jgi:hypothetical protein